MTCATCKHSQYLKLNLHTCSNFDTPSAVAVDGNYHCQDWEPLLVSVGRGMSRFGALCGCERCRV